MQKLDRLLSSNSQKGRTCTQQSWKLECMHACMQEYSICERTHQY
uniref:Uncharacterized protein n=1 Tax=Manihot esculenta TaxID=3983 RepID=A0A2C9VQY6_MANES